MASVFSFNRIVAMALRVPALVGVLALLAPPVLAADWHPEEPGPDSKDWVQLTSGEWVRGSIDLFRDLEMQFDSDDLDDLTIDWEDIAAFRSPRMLTLVFTGNRVATGTASMKDGVIRVTTRAGELEFQRGELLSIIEGEPREINFWSAKGSLGFTGRSGNTNQSDLAAQVRIRREATLSRFNLAYNGNFSEISGEQTTNNHRGTADINYFLSRKFYVTPLSLELYADEFQNIDQRTTVGAGAGYYFYRSGDLEWSVGLGGAYRKTSFTSVEAGDDASQETGAVVPSTAFDADLTGDIELTADYTAQIGVPDAKQSTHHAGALLTIDLVGDILELSTSFTWDRVESPQRDADGDVPKRDDFRLSLGFSVDI
jgi:putative salt-induced outer membrane protein YdiY